MGKHTSLENERLFIILKVVCLNILFIIEILSFNIECIIHPKPSPYFILIYFISTKLKNQIIIISHAKFF